MRSFRKNLASVYLVTTVNGILGIAFVPLAVKLLGLDGYGLYSMYAVMASYVALVDLGVSKYFVLQLSKEKEASIKTRHFQTALGIYLVLSALLFLSLPLLLYLIPKYILSVPGENISALRWIVFFSIIEYFLAIPSALRQMSCVSNERFDRYSLFTFTSGLYRYALMFLGIFVFGTPAAVVGLVVSRRFLDIVTSRFILGALPRGSFIAKLDFKGMKTIIGRSSTLSVSQLFQSTVVSIGSILVNRYSGLNGLGIYRSAFDLSNKIWFISNGIGLVVFPRFVRMLSEKVHRARLFSRILWLLNTSWAGYSLLAVCGMVIAPRALSIIGLSGSDSVQLFVLLLLGVSWNAHANLSYEFLQAAGRFRQAAVLSAFSLLVMVACFYILYGSTGILAIGWAWIISQAIYAYLADALTISISELPVQPIMLMFKSIVGGGALLVVSERLGHSSNIAMITGSLIVIVCSCWAFYEYKGSLKKAEISRYA